ILSPSYLAGFNLAEAFYLATPVLSWKAVVVGDPLLRPFAGRSLTSAELEESIDERTGLPRRFASRRVVQAAAASTGIPEAAVVLGVRAETLFARGDKAGARNALEEAVKSAPAAIVFVAILAQLEESDGLYPAAIGRFRRIIEIQPTNVLALNNLAYALAVRSNLPAERLPLAKQAAALAPQNGDVLDTWAWIEHLVGND